MILNYRHNEFEYYVSFWIIIQFCRYFQKKYLHDFLVNNITRRLHWFMAWACECSKLRTIFFTQHLHTYTNNCLQLQCTRLHRHALWSHALSKLPIFNPLKKVCIESNNLNNASESIIMVHIPNNIINQCPNFAVWSSKYH